MFVSRRILAVLVLSVGLTACSESDVDTATSVNATAATSTATSSPAEGVETTQATVETTVPTAAETTTTTVAEGTRLEISVTGGEVTGGGRLDIPLGDDVVIAVTSDTADEVHLHTYDVKIDLVAGETGELVFTADIPGIFELEMEDSGIELAELQVSP